MSRSLDALLMFSWGSLDVLSLSVSSVHTNRVGCFDQVGVWVDGEAAVHQVLNRLSTQSIMAALHAQAPGIPSDARIEVGFVRVLLSSSPLHCAAFKHAARPSTRM